MLQPKYSLIGPTPSKITLLNNDHNSRILSDQNLTENIVDSTSYDLKKKDKNKKSYVKYGSKVNRHTRKETYAIAGKGAASNEIIDAQLGIYRIFVYTKKIYKAGACTKSTLQILITLHELLLFILIYIIYINMSMEQFAKLITDAIDMQKQVIQNNITTLNNTIVGVAKEMLSAINNIRPAQNYGLPQSMNMSKVIIKDNSGDMQIEADGLDKDTVKKEIQKEMNTIKENFWTTKFLSSNTYCKKCQQLRHKDTNCKFMCNMCNGNHQANICTHRLHCKWCGQRKGEHKCESFGNIYRTKIKCPICKLKGHFGKECNLLFLALSTNWRKSNSINRRRRRFRTKLGVNFRRNNRRMAVRTK